MINKKINKNLVIINFPKKSNKVIKDKLNIAIDASEHMLEDV
jgi:hypothetical protein